MDRGSGRLARAVVETIHCHAVGWTILIDIVATVGAKFGKEPIESGVVASLFVAIRTYRVDRKKGFVGADIAHSEASFIVFATIVEKDFVVADKEYVATACGVAHRGFGARACCVELSALAIFVAIEARCTNMVEPGVRIVVDWDNIASSCACEVEFGRLGNCGHLASHDLDYIGIFLIVGKHIDVACVGK